MQAIHGLNSYIKAENTNSMDCFLVKSFPQLFNLIYIDLIHLNLVHNGLAAPLVLNIEYSPYRGD